MKEGRASRTSEIVCMGRAFAHGRFETSRFQDPVALLLLPEESRQKVTRLRAGASPRTLRGYVGRAYLERHSRVMVARTIAIDDVVREAASPQLVILGAGLDGRAFRMPELGDTVVFEVDHPDTQRDKVARTATLAKTAREVRFVPVNFERDDLGQALQAAGHDPSLPTTWLWEGVVMYLTTRDIEATLAVVRDRSAPGSVLNVLYHQPAKITTVVGFLLRRLGEPLRSSFSPDAMRKLLARFSLDVVRDESLAEIGAKLTDDTARGTRFVGHLRLVTARRVAH
jgi:methyltransferase (TIGR00027 family)